MYEPNRHYARINKSDRERQTSYDFTYVESKSKTDEQI